MDKNLHILCPDVPWPADYGGVIDPFYLLVQLKAVGIQVYLHCFTQNRAPQKELEKYCKEVHYYRRDKTALLSNTLPYIVKSRSSKKLLQELGKNNYPILMQGIHTTYFLYKKLLPNRKILLRPFNVESTYYQQLSALEINPFKKYFFKRESRLLKSYEKEVSTMIPILALSQTDKQFFEEQNARSYFIPVIIPWHEVSILAGTGNYCLYHGNLSVNENQKAVEWLLTKVFNDLEFPIFFAGKNPNPKTAKLISKNKNAALIANPTESKMQELIKNAQINLALSFNHTGIKLKILNALFNGRHCIANLQAVRGSGIEALVSVADDAENMKKAILELMALPVTEEQKGRRSAVLNDVYNNKKNTEKIIAMIY